MMFDLGLRILKLFAVAGAATVGGLGAGLFLRLVVKLTVHRPVPRRVIVPVQILGAIALALAVWMWAFGEGGPGLGLGGGFGLGGTGGQGPGKGKSSDAPAERKSENDAQPDSSPHHHKISPDHSDIMRVEMLGGSRVQAQKFYAIDGENEPKTLPELRAIILARQKQEEKKPLKTLEIVIYENSVAQDHPAVKDLEKWARQNDLTVTLSFPKGNRP